MLHHDTLAEDTQVGGCRPVARGCAVTVLSKALVGGWGGLRGHTQDRRGLEHAPPAATVRCCCCCC